jgi:hypothetical protein
LVLAFIGACYGIAQGDTYKAFRHFAAKKLPGHTVIQHQPGNLKVENDQMLVYVK